jgi:hypothetical protein
MYKLYIYLTCKTHTTKITLTTTLKVALFIKVVIQETTHIEVETLKIIFVHMGNTKSMPLQIQWTLT